MTTRRAGALAVLACALIPVLAGCASDGSAFGDASPSAVPAATGPDPTFSYSGDPQCAITYKGDGDGSMSWTATVTVAGELITHASDNQGDINRHDVQVTPGPNNFTAPEPLNDIGDIGGVLYVGSPDSDDSPSYACSIAPAR